MMRLAQLQQTFVEAMFDQQDTEDCAVCQCIDTSAGPPAKQKVAIYRSAIISSYTRVLGEVYPVIKRLLGEAFFDAMAKVYIRQNPSLQPDLNIYGERFDDFLRSFEPVKVFEYLPDMARLEWYWHEIFFEADETLVDFSVLARLDETAMGRVIFKMPTAARLMRSPFPISRIWTANQTACEEVPAIDLQQGGEYLLVWRQGYERNMQQLSEQQWRVLNALGSHRQFQYLVENLAHDGEISRMLPEFVQRGWITGFDLNH